MKAAYVGGEGRSVVWETWTWYFNYELWFWKITDSGQVWDFLKQTDV